MSVLVPSLAFVPGTSLNIAATTTSQAAVIDCTGCDKIHVANTSATLYAAVRIGVGAPTAALTTDLAVPPMGQVILAANEGITGVAAIASAAGPSAIRFTPLRKGT